MCGAAPNMGSSLLGRQQSSALVDNSTLSLASPRFSLGSAVGSPSMGSSRQRRTRLIHRPARHVVARRSLVRRVLRGQRSDVFRIRQSSLERDLPWLDVQWTAGLRNGSELWRRMKSQRFRGCLRVVCEWAGRRRGAESLRRVPSARTIARQMTTGRDTLSTSQTVTFAESNNRHLPGILSAQQRRGNR